MAENEDRSSEDLTDEASQTRLEEFRRKGQVAQSREVSGLLALVGAGVCTYVMAPKMGAQMAEFMREVFRADITAHTDLGGAHVAASFLIKALKIGLAIGMPVGLVGFALGAAGSFVQIGSIFSTDPLQMDAEKISPLAGLKRIFSMQHLIESLRIVIKMIVIVAVAYGVAKSEVISSPAYITGEEGSILAALGHSGKVMFFALVGVMTLFAAVDFGISKWQFNKKLRLTKQEAKQEHKEREGDPMVKSRIRAIQREFARRRMMTAVKKADVIVTNPTHFAVALKYEKDSMFAPRVVAKGADFLAQKIKKVASDAGVPLVENVPLARTLYKTVKVGQYVPRALYQAVAEVLSYVYRLKNRKF